jgi:hypothetical protein
VDFNLPGAPPALKQAVERYIRQVLSFPWRLWPVATASLPTASTENEGGIVYDETTSQLAYSDGAAWKQIAALGGGAALTKTDDTNVTLTLGGSPTTALLAATSLTLGWTGSLAVARGGTGDTGTAWTTWSPTITSGGGTVTGATISTTAKYKTLGKTVFWSISCTITAKGSGSPTGSVIFTTPGGQTPVNANNAGAGFYINSGHALAVLVSSDAHVYALKYEGSTLWVDGDVFTLSGVYEAA